MNGHDTNSDTMTFTLKKTKAIWSTVATVAGALALLLGGVNTLVDYRFDKRVKDAAKDPLSMLNMTIENQVEEKMAEMVQTVIDDDVEVLEREIARLERRVERLEDE